MNIQKHNIIRINDENGDDVVGAFLFQLYEDSKKSHDAKLHLMFLQSAFNLLSVNPLEKLVNDKTEITITIDGEERTKAYELVKPLRLAPIYELRYAMNGNEHLRFLFFPFKFKGQSNYVFVKCLKKTRSPWIDDTDVMRDLTYQMFKKVQENPEKYLEGDE